MHFEKIALEAGQRMEETRKDDERITLTMLLGNSFERYGNLDWDGNNGEGERW